MSEQEEQKAFVDSNVWLKKSKSGEGLFIVVDSASPIQIKGSTKPEVLTVAVSLVKKLMAGETKGVMFSRAPFTRSDEKVE